MLDGIALAQECAASVHPNTVVKIMRVESQFNPYAIGVVGGRLERQPKNLSEAIATAKSLDKQGMNYSVGLMQVNRANFERLGLTLDTVFDSCRNVAAGAKILTECYERAARQPSRVNAPQLALRDAFSCYYSGNFKTGYSTGYVLKVVTGEGRVVLDTKRSRPIPQNDKETNSSLGDASPSAMLF